MHPQLTVVSFCISSLCYVTGCWIGCSCVTGHLIGLLEILGTLSMTAGELKQLISLFRVDEEGKQVCSLFEACEWVYVKLVSVCVRACMRAHACVCVCVCER